MVDFLLVDQPSAYNATIGRPTLNAIQVIVSIYHLVMKFPAGNLVGEVRGDQVEARQCYAMSTKVVEKHKMVNTIFHMEDVEALPAPENISHVLGELDLREKEMEKRDGLLEELKSIKLDHQHPELTIQIGSQLPGSLWDHLVDFLKEHRDVFALSHKDMPDIDLWVTVHRLNVDPTYKPGIQECHRFNLEQYTTISVEVDKLLMAKFIRETHYPEWLGNIVMVQKANDKWRIYIDYTYPNKACPKDSFSLPWINQLVEATTIDAYYGYN